MEKKSLNQGSATPSLQATSGPRVIFTLDCDKLLSIEYRYRCSLQGCADLMLIMYIFTDIFVTL